MQALQIIAACVLCVAAVITLIVAFAEESVAALGAAVLAAGLGAFGMQHGIHGEFAKFHGKHEAILRDITRQGFRVPSDQVYAVGGNYLYGTEVDIAEGRCTFAFPATKLGGVWRVTLPSRDGNGVTVLSPGGVARLAEGCKRGFGKR